MPRAVRMMTGREGRHYSNETMKNYYFNPETQVTEGLRVIVRHEHAKLARAKRA